MITPRQLFIALFLARHVLHVENPGGFVCLTGFLLSRLCKKPIFVFPNPPCPPYQGGIRVTSPPDKGDLGGWVFRQRNLRGFLAQSLCTDEATLPIMIPAGHKYPQGTSTKVSK